MTGTTYTTPAAALAGAKADASRYGKACALWRNAATGEWLTWEAASEPPSGYGHALTVSPTGETLSTGPAMRHVGRVA